MANGGDDELLVLAISWVSMHRTEIADVFLSGNHCSDPSRALLAEQG